MASVIKQPGTQYYIACFRDHLKRQRRKTTRETNRKRAQKIADQYEAIARRSVPPKIAREWMAQLYFEAYGLEAPTKTFKEFTNIWMETKRVEVSARTLSHYETYLARLINFLGELAGKEIIAISRQHLTDFRNFLSKQLSPASVNNHVTMVKHLFSTAKRDGYVVESPAEFLDAVPVRNNFKADAFTLEEIRSLLFYADPEWTSMIMFGLYTGQRMGDLATLSWENVDLARNEIRLTTKKTGKALVIPIAEPLREYIESLPVTDDPKLFFHPTLAELYPRASGSSCISNRFSTLMIKAKLNFKGVEAGQNRARARNRLGFHSFRRTAVSLLKDHGCPQAVVEEIVGHSNAETSAIYTRVGEEAKLRELNKLPDIRK
jgi:integrase